MRTVFQFSDGQHSRRRLRLAIRPYFRKISRCAPPIAPLSLVAFSRSAPMLPNGRSNEIIARWDGRGRWKPLLMAPLSRFAEFLRSS